MIVRCIAPEAVSAGRPASPLLNTLPQALRLRVERLFACVADELAEDPEFCRLYTAHAPRPAEERDVAQELRLLLSATLSRNPHLLTGRVHSSQIWMSALKGAVASPSPRAPSAERTIVGRSCRADFFSARKPPPAKTPTATLLHSPFANARQQLYICADDSSSVLDVAAWVLLSVLTGNLAKNLSSTDRPLRLERAAWSVVTKETQRLLLRADQFAAKRLLASGQERFSDAQAFFAEIEKHGSPALKTALPQLRALADRYPVTS
jgi:hypothetical protein